MLITKKHIPLRTFLLGAGVAIGLPLLDAGKTFCGHLASAWGSSRILESSPGRFRFRIFVYHETLGAVP